MMSRKRKTVSALMWVFTVLMCVCIFYMSSCNSTDSEAMSTGIKAIMEKIFGYGFTDFFVRKCAHTIEYMMLGFFSAGAVLASFLKPKNLLFSTLACVLYAASDEIHQLYVPGRACQVRDVLIDSAGIVAGTLAALLIFYLVMKRKKADSSVRKKQ